MPRVLSCPKCSFETTESLKQCPSCGSQLQSAKKVRILGWVQLAIGTFLVLFMSGLAVFLGGIIAQSDEPGATTRFSGGPEHVALIMTIFGLVIAFGLAAMVSGIWQIKYGKPNRPLMIGILVVFGILFIIARAVKIFG